VSRGLGLNRGEVMGKTVARLSVFILRFESVLICSALVARATRKDFVETETLLQSTV
jgi:hypothetical protein